VLATPDYRFLIDNLQIIRNGTQYFNDDFGNGAPPPQGLNLTGTTTPVSYGTQGTFTESGGRAIMDGSFSVPIASVGTTDPFHGSGALLLTDTSPNMSLGLKSDDTFSVEGRFDLVMPGMLQAYGIRLTDIQNNDIVDVRVRQEADGIVRVVLRDVDVPANTITTLGTLALEPLAGENQIVLRLTHDVADPGVIHASFDLLGGAAPRSFSFAPVGHIFGSGTPGDPSDDEVFTRASIVAIGPSDQQNGVYGTLHVDSDGQWTYALDNSAASVQALAQGEHATDVFTVNTSDGLGGADTQTVRVDVVGADDAPFVTSQPPFALNGGYVVEDGVHQVATGVAAGSDPDHGASLHWSVTRGSAYSANYLVQLDDLTVTKNGAAFFSDNFNDGIAPTAPGGAPAGFTYLPSGAFSEAGGRAVLNGAVANSQRGVGIDALQAGHLLTVGSNIDPADLTRGLKSDDDFDVAATYDLSLPASGYRYGVSLSDNTTGSLPQDQLGDDLVAIEVSNDGGNTSVRLVERNVVADTVSVIDSMQLTPLLAGDTQIVLHLSHDADHVGVIHASFDLLGGVPGPRHFELTQTAQIFGTGTPDYAGDDENWTRVQLLAFGPDQGGSSAQGQYGTVSIDANTGAWSYQLDNNSAPVQNLSHGLSVVDPFNVRVTDEFGLSSFRSYNISVVGTGDPVPTGPFSFTGSTNPQFQNETFVGSAGNDTFAAGSGNDLLVGLDGADTFDYNNLSEGGDTISDFTPGVGGDRLDLHDLLVALGSYVPGVSNPADFVLVLASNSPDMGPSTLVMVDPDGAGGNPGLFGVAQLHGTTGVTYDSLLADGNLIL
jgi:VCBS repeat-containing protein